MINLLISIVVFAASFFMIVYAIRYGDRGAIRLDQYFSNKNNSQYPGFQWYFRIPFYIGVIPEYFYAIILTYDYYYKKNWWPLKIASYISVLLFIALLKSRSAVYDYLTFNFIVENGILALFTSGNFVIFMNIIVISYLALFVMICIESFKMHGIYAPARILVYSLLSFLLANLTIISLSIIVFVAVAYVALKIIGFLFFSSKKGKKEENNESTGSILNSGFKEFKSDLYHWESENRNSKIAFEEEEKTKVVRKKPKITRRRKKTEPMDDEIPRLHPD